MPSWQAEFDSRFFFLIEGKGNWFARNVFFIYISNCFVIYIWNWFASKTNIYMEVWSSFASVFFIKIRFWNWFARMDFLTTVGNWFASWSILWSVILLSWRKYCVSGKLTVTCSPWSTISFWLCEWISQLFYIITKQFLTQGQKIIR